MLLEGERLAFGASGRNGGFCAASLTHGIGNGARALAGRDGRARADGPGEPRRRSAATIARHGIDCGWEETGTIDVATAPHQLAVAGGGGRALRALRLGRRAARRRRRCARRSTRRPTSAACGRRDASRARRSRRGCAGGSRARPRRAGARVYEGTPVTALRARRRGRARRDARRARARARARCWRRARSRRSCARSAATSCPVYDYVLVTEPLSAAQRDAIGWRGAPGALRPREPVPLLPPDRRRPDPLGRLRRGLRLRRPRRRPSATSGPRRSTLLAEHFFATFPQLEGLRLLAPLGRRDRHVQPLLRAVGARARRPRGLRRRLHRARRRREPLRRARRARPARRRSTPSARGWRWSGGGRSRSRPSRRAGPGSRSRSARSRAPTTREGRRGPWLRALDRLGLGFDS